MSTFPYDYIPSPSTGRPLAGGKLYFGVAETDPTVESNQIPVYIVQNDGSLVQTEQPINVGSNGTPIYSGFPVQLRIEVSEYSFVALNSQDVEVYNESYVYND